LQNEKFMAVSLTVAVQAAAAQQLPLRRQNFNIGICVLSIEAETGEMLVRQG
jgi:hypothetical protein